MRKKLTDRQKLNNKKKYALIRKYYNKIDTTSMTYKAYKSRVMYLAKDSDLSLSKAAKKLNNSEIFTSAAERSRTNMINAMKDKFKDSYKEMQQLMRDEKGHYKNISKSLTWDKDRGMYTFTDKNNKLYGIDTTNSPENIYLVALDQNN